MALSSDSEKTAQVTADSVQYNNKTGVAKYIGHVKATQGTTIVTAEQITLYRNDDNDIERIVATGKPAQYSTQPAPNQPRLQASANTIEYYPLQGKVQLIDQGIATMGNNRFSANHITYDMNQQLLESSTRYGGQSTIVLEPTRKPPTQQRNIRS